VPASLPLRQLLGNARARAERDAHARLLEANIQRIKRMVPDFGRGAAGAGGHAAIVASQPVGSTVSMRIPDVGGFLTGGLDYCRQHFVITARVVYNGTRAIVLEDAAAPLAAQMDTIYQKVGREVDDHMFELDRFNFADPLRMDDVLDANGKVIMLFSPRVNSFAGIAGFVVTCDFETPQTSPSSNRAEVFYAVVPTDPGTDTTVERTRTGWYRTIRATVVHELKHIAAFANRIRDFGRSLEESWMEEGTARIAEELWSRTAAYGGLQQRGNALYEGTVYCDWRPSNPAAPQCVGTPYAMGRSFRDFALYDFMKDPEQHSPMGPKLGAIDGSWYGTSWALLRWVADHSAVDEATFFSSLVRTPQAGVTNLTARAGRSWEELLGEWSLAMYVDDLPGFTPLNARLAFPSWNLRSIYGGMHADFGPPLYNPPRFNPAYPLVPRTQSFGNFAVTVDKVLGGGFALFELSGTQTGRQLIQLLGPSGGAPSPRFRVAVVRTN
jgi:hypothetical protein